MNFRTLIAVALIPLPSLAQEAAGPAVQVAGPQAAQIANTAPGTANVTPNPGQTTPASRADTTRRATNPNPAGPADAQARGLGGATVAPPAPDADTRGLTTAEDAVRRPPQTAEDRGIPVVETTPDGEVVGAEEGVPVPLPGIAVPGPLTTRDLVRGAGDEPAAPAQAPTGTAVRPAELPEAEALRPDEVSTSEGVSP